MTASSFVVTVTPRCEIAQHAGCRGWVRAFTDARTCECDCRELTGGVPAMA